MIVFQESIYDSKFNILRRVNPNTIDKRLLWACLHVKNKSPIDVCYDRYECKCGDDLPHAC